MGRGEGGRQDRSIDPVSVGRRARDPPREAAADTTHLTCRHALLVLGFVFCRQYIPGSDLKADRDCPCALLDVSLLVVPWFHLPCLLYLG